MATYISIQLSGSYNDASSAWSGAFTNGQEGKWYDEDLITAPNATGLNNGDVVLNDDGGGNPASAFDGGNSFYYATVGGNVLPAVFQVDGSGVISSLDLTMPTTSSTTTTSTTTTSTTSTTSTTTTTLPLFTCTEANLQITAGNAGDPTQGTVDEGTIVGINPATYQVGSTQYTATIEAPAGYSNEGSNIPCTFTLGVTTDAPPTAPNFSRTMINNGGGSDFVILDFTDPSTNGWSGSAVTDNEDDFGSGLNIVITSIAGNGDVYDHNDANSSPISNNTQLLNTSNTPKIRYVPNVAYASGGTDNIQYKVVDSAGNESTGTISITVNAPANQPPSVNPISLSITSAQQNDDVVFNIRDYVNDDNDSDENLTYYWCTSSGTIINEITYGGNFPSVNHGTLTQISQNNPQLIRYTYTGATLQPNQADKTDTVWYKVEDSSGEDSSVQTISITMSAAANNPPVFNPVSDTRSVAQYNTVSGNVSQYVTDVDGHTITYSSQQTAGEGNFTLNQTTGEWSYDSGNWNITPSQTVQAIFVITAADNYGGSATHTLTINVTGVSYITITRSGFTNSSDNACSISTGNQAYLNGSQASNINQLQVGDAIYDTTALTTKLTPSTATNNWVSVQQSINGTVVKKAVQVDATTGNILSVINCAVTTGQAWPIRVNYSDDATDVCSGTFETAIVWQNVIDATTIPNLPLGDIVDVGGQLFSSEYYANQYSGVTAPAGVCIPNGFYNDQYTPDNYYEFVNGAWEGGIQSCPERIQYETYSVKAFWNEQSRTNTQAACLSGESLLETTLWFRADNTLGIDSLSEEAKLEYVLQNQIVPFKTQGGATSIDYNDIWDNTAFIAAQPDPVDPSTWTYTDKIAIWENDNSSGYTGNYRWIGVDVDGNLTEGTASTVLGQCSLQFTQPVASPNFCLGLDGYPCEPGEGDNSRENVFYAFMSCTAKVENGDLYWPMYVIDGLHTVDPTSTSYIKEFIDIHGNTAVNIGGSTLIGCMKLQHKIFAVNIEDAVSVLKSEAEYTSNEVRPIGINPVDLGFTSAATIAYGYDDCKSCLLGATAPNEFTLDIVDDAELINRSVPNFDLEKNYQLDNVAKPLLRTNPKLSTNAKLVVNSTGKMFIESIDATKELASVEYKKYAVNKDGKWAYDLPRFFKKSKTPTDQMFVAKKSFSDYSVQESFEKQIEEDYHYGTTYNYSKLHNEDFRILAPIWLDKNLPSKFVIFRVSDPAALDFDQNTNFDNISKILANSEIIETFDLTRKSDLGTYIRNHVQSETFPKHPINVNFDKNERTSYNGIDLKEGGFTSKGEYLYEDFVKKDQTLIAENNLITGGFERNALACANIMNLEFLFDDNGAGDYAVNRYFGLYVNDIDSGYGTLNSAEDGLLRFKTLNSYINKDPKSAIPPFKLIANTPTLGYAHVGDNFYKISSKVFYNPAELEVRVEDSSNIINKEVKLAPTGKSVEIIKNGEPGNDFIRIDVVDSPAVNDRFGIFPSKEQLYRIKFSRYTPGDVFTLSMTLGGVAQNINLSLQQSLDGMINLLNFVVAGPSDGNIVFEKEGDSSIIFYEKRSTLQLIEPSISGAVNNTTLARIEELQVPYDLTNNMFFATDGLPAGHFNSTSFSNQGTKSEITTAIVKSINAADNGFTAITYDKAEHFYIKTDVVGYKLLQAGIAIPHDNANNWANISAANEDIDNRLRLNIVNGSTDILSNSSIYFFSGGNSRDKSMLVTLDSIQDINIGDYIETRSSGVYNKVVDIVEDIERLPLQYNKVILERSNTIESGEVKVFADNLVRLGLFSAFDIHDMNFDFYDTSNSELKELQWETPGEINYEPEVNNTSDIYPFGDKDNTEYTLDPVNYFTGLNDVLSEERADEFNEVIITSEYDRLQENSLKEYAVTSRVVPTINKWVLKDTVTVREQPYYLNANEAFGRSNFSADLSVNGRDRLGMTHEWFYVNNLPKHLIENQGDNTNPAYRLNDSFSYVNFMEGFEMNPTMFKDTNYDYFDRFFVTEGFETQGDNNYKTFVKTNRQKKYTLIDGGNDMSFANSIFKGLKVVFKNRKEFTASSPVDFVKSSEFNGYRFSVLLNVKTAQDSNGIEYEVVQNKKFKFVVFFITVSIDDLWADRTLTKKLLYELNHSLVWNNEEQTFKYSDIKVDGCLDLNSLNQTNSASSDYLILQGLPHADGTVPQFLEQINKNTDDAFGNLIIKLNTAFGPQYLQANILKLEGQEALKLKSPIVDITNGVDPTTGEYPVADLDNLPHYLQWNAEYTYIQGGINAYKSILDALSAQNVATMLLREPNNVKYSTVNVDGSIEQNKFIILFEDGVEIVKESYIVTSPDEDKPESFKLFSGNIGYNLDAGLTYYPFLIRHNGGYTIDTRPVVTFTDIYAHMKTNTLQNSANVNEISLEEQMYKHSLSNVREIDLAKDYYRKYNRCGVAFNLGFIYDGGTHDSNWGKIKNHFYRKVNEFNASGVTKLSTSTDKLPLYPLIGEVAIDKKDVHVFKSSWDKGYYTRALSGGGTEEVPGTFETKEERSYLASTIMKIKDSYTLLDFEVLRVESEEEQDEILVNSTNTTDMVVFEDDDRVVMDFYIDYTINKQLGADGVLAAISKYVEPADSAEDKTTLEDDAKLYIDKNLVNVFGVNQIKLYTKRIKGEPSSIENAGSLDGLDNGGYVADQNFTFNAHEQKPLNFRLIYNKRLGYSYRIRPMVKITS